MKPQIDFAAAFSHRCEFRDSSGRQCRNVVLDPYSTLCGRHTMQQAKNREPNVFAPLIRNSQGLQTAQGINHTLMNLYELLATNQISPRRAAVLAYINSLLLRTLPAIDRDIAVGITDPTLAPSNLETPIPNLPGNVSAKVEHPEPAPLPNPCCPSIPEPNPASKPS